MDVSLTASGAADTDMIRVEKPVDGVALVTFNSPSTLNSMTGRFVEQLTHRLDELAAEETTRVIVITGAGRAFSSGHDLGELRGFDQQDIEGTYGEQTLYSQLIIRVREMPQPVIAAVNGPAAGGGLAMALAADTRICDSTALFTAPFVRLGLSGCDVGVSYLLPRTVGPTLAFEMMLTGRLVDAAEAHRAGMVLSVVDDGHAVEAAIDLAREVARNPLFALRMTKNVMWSNLDATSLATAVELENRTQAMCSRTSEFAAALEAYLRDYRGAGKHAADDGTTHGSQLR